MSTRTRTKNEIAVRSARSSDDEAAARGRILDAAFATFMEHGYAAASTLEIATRARVSKRELYALVGNKLKMLVACIERRAQRLQIPADLPDPHDRDSLRRALEAFGKQLLREISEPAVVAMFRLAIAEATRAPEVAQALASIGGETSRAALRDILAAAEAVGLLTGQPVQLAEQFDALLWGDLLLDLLLGLVARPSPRECAGRARDAVEAFLQLHPQPSHRPSSLHSL
jgi:AcrR family transcriptional regulator